MSGTKFISDRLFSLSKNNLSSTVMRLAVTSVALAIVVMLISLAVVVGFKNQIRDKVVGFVAPVQIKAFDANESLEEMPFEMDEGLIHLLENTRGIKHFQQVANKAGMIKTDEEIHGVIMKGVGSDYDWSYFKNCLIAGDVPAYLDTVSSNDVLVSRNIANKMLLSVGDAVRVWFIDEDMQARGRKFDVKGIFETGLWEYDERYVFCDINQIRKLNGWTKQESGLSQKAVGVVEVWIDDVERMDEVCDTLLRSGLPYELTAESARSNAPGIFDWLDLLDANVWLILVLMFLVAGITMVSMLLIIIIEKTSTIGLLKAMGATNRFVRNVFLYRSLRILLIGMVIGNVVGLGFCLLQYYTGFVHLDPETYYLSSVPVELHLSTVLILNAGTFVLWMLMLLIPTSIINRIRPSRSIRFE